MNEHMHRKRWPAHALYSHTHMWLCILTVSILGIDTLTAHARGWHGRQLNERGGHGTDFLNRQAWYYEPSTPYHILDRSRAFTGDDSRMKVFTARLMLGLPVKVAVLGGSVSQITRESAAYDSGWLSFFHKWLELTFTPCGDEYPWPRTRPRSPDAKPPTHQPTRISSEFNGPSGQTFIPEDAPHLSQNHDNYLYTTHICNASNIEMHNLAAFAATAEFLESCRLPQVPPDVNLVIIEAAVNDYQANLTRPSPAMERMVRAALALPGRPAVMFFTTYSMGWSSGRVANGRLFGTDIEESHMKLANWYGNVQLLAMRPVLYHTIMANPDNRGVDVFFDHIHLTHAGNIFYSDILVHMVQGMVRRLRADMRDCQTSQVDASQRPASADSTGGHNPAADTELCRQVKYVLRLATGRSHNLPEAIKAVNSKNPTPSRSNQTHSAYLLPQWSSNITQHHAFLPEQTDRPSSHIVAGPLDPEIPPPLIPGNFASSGQRSCVYSEDLPSILQEAGPGWEFMDEAHARFKRKFGYVTNATGVPLVLRAEWCNSLGTSSPSAEGKGTRCPAPPKSTLHLMYLQSERPVMGKANVTCMGGCSCEPSVVDAYKPGQGSLVATHAITANAIGDSSSGEPCYVRVEVLTETSSNGTMFKVSGLAAGWNNAEEFVVLATITMDGYMTGRGRL